MAALTYRPLTYRPLTRVTHRPLRPRGLEVALIQILLKSHDPGVLEAKDKDMKELESNSEDHEHPEEHPGGCVCIPREADLVIYVVMCFFALSVASNRLLYYSYLRSG